LVFHGHGDDVLLAKNCLASSDLADVHPVRLRKRHRCSRCLLLVVSTGKGGGNGLRTECRLTVTRADLS